MWTAGLRKAPFLKSLLGSKNIWAVGGAVFDSPPVELLVGSVQTELETHGSRDSQPAHDHHQDECQQIPGLVLLQEEVRSDEISDLAQHVDCRVSELATISMDISKPTTNG